MAINTIIRKSGLLSTTMCALFLGAALAVPQAADAKPAKRGIILTEQPDGSVIPTYKVGDEFAHRVLSEDGYILVLDEQGYLNYATVNGENIVSTGRRAKAVDQRSADDRSFLQSIDKTAALQLAETTDIEAGNLRRERMAAGNIRRQAPAKALNSQGINLLFNEFPSTGSPNVLVILVEFNDTPFTTANAYEYFENMLNQKGFSTNGANGSVLDFMEQNSYGKFTPKFDLYGPVKVSKNMAYYGGNDYSGNDKAPEEMVIEACQLLDDQIDFSKYDNDGDGIVDNIYVFYAGYGEADTPSTTRFANTIWPHSYNLSYTRNLSLDGVKLDRYACSNEIDYTTKKADGVGTFCHEFSHVMGLPDLYDVRYTIYGTQGELQPTPGTWSTLDGGPYNNNGRTPPNYGVFERYSLGWLEPKRFSGTGEREIVLEPIETNQAWLVPTTNRNEFMLIEARNQTGWDKYIPNSGMLVWRIDYSKQSWTYNQVNTSLSHQRVDIIEADNNYRLTTVKGDCFPGTSNNTSFTVETVPSFTTRTGKEMGVEFTNIERDAATGNIILQVSTTLDGDIESGYGRDLYIVGENFGAWSDTDPAYRFIQDNDAYTLTLENGIQGEWKIWDGTWDYAFGAGAEDVAVGENDVWFCAPANFKYNYDGKVILKLTIPEGSDVKDSSIPAKLEINAMSGINGIGSDAGFSYSLIGRTLTVASPAPVKVFDITGRHIATIADGSFTLPAAGVYLLNNGQKTVKLIAK